MKKHDGMKRGFVQVSRAWFGPVHLMGESLVDEVTIGFYDFNGGTTGEFKVSWGMLGGRVVPCLEAFDDGWSALFNFGDLLESMADADSEKVSPEDFCALLRTLGVEDMTPVVNPNAEAVGGSGANLLGELAYMEAARVSGCTVPWSEADQAAWNTGAAAVVGWAAEYLREESGDGPPDEAVVCMENARMLLLAAGAPDPRTGKPVNAD